MLDGIKEGLENAFAGVAEAIRETWNAITAETDREIGIFAIPLITDIFATAAQYTIYLNSGKDVIFRSLSASGVCNTWAPFSITSMLGSFQNNPLVHVAMCQAVSLNIAVFLAWFGEFFAILLFAILVFEAIFHLG